MLITPDVAEYLALKAIEWVVCDTYRTNEFLQITGLLVQDFKKAAVSTEGIIAILEFALSSDRTTQSLAEFLSCTPEDIQKIYASFPETQSPHWT